ncbi:RNA-directed DNA polymerase [Neisseria subflava]|uniref:RNA-directed DNA polymerase n=1 Tax=Neisseria subflava TaxID=28449 RepID=UPI00202A055C|nr:RNA-directed DNA polymerase [Neisseria subflava]MCL9788398.1 RNA-directed DNA polymerase [Neisseria subflava]
MKIDGKLTESAYIYLKNHVYYENLNLFMRGRISSFEKKNKLLDEGGENIFEKIAKIISDNNTDELDKWINSISFRIIPKSFKASSQENKTNEEGRFISNDKRTDTHNPEKLNYFIDASAEVYIIDMLWSLYVGPILDGMLTEDCYGNRLRNHAKEFIKKYVEGNNVGDVSRHNNLFIRYIDQYNKWRNNAINRARLLSEDNSFGIISLDLKEFFYNVDIDLDKVEKIIVKKCNQDISQDIIDNALKLNNLLKRIFKKYYAVVKKGLNVTHNKCKDKKILPIGLTSSSILSNWYMIDFDKKIQEKLKPIYYGRYVDDILIVLSNPIFDEKDPLKSLYKKYFVNTRILVSGNDNESYIIKGKNISIQKRKLYFNFLIRLIVKLD